MINLINFLGRVVGIIFLLGGLFCAYDAYTHPGLKDRWGGIVVACVMAVLGFLLIIARPYKPSSDDD